MKLLAEGEAKIDRLFPDLEGWWFAAAVGNGRVNLGFFRGLVSAKLQGFAGIDVALSATIGVDTMKKGAPILVGVDRAVLSDAMTGVKSGSLCEAGAFAGVQVGGT